MDVIVDQARHLPVEGTPSDLMSLLAAVTDVLHKEGRAILSLKVEGQEIRPDELTAVGDRSLEGVGTIEITSEAVSVLADRALQELEEVLPELPKACHALAAIFQGRTPTDGYEPFQRLAQIWGAVKERELEAAQALNFPIEEIRVDGRPIARMHEDLNRYLEEAAEALQSGDCVLLGDLLEYELAPRARQEAEIVAALRRCALQPTA